MDTGAHKAELRQACEDFGVLAGPINTIEDLLQDPSFVEREFFQTIDHPETGPLVYPGYHFNLHREEGPMPERRHAPLLGAHTKEVLDAAAPRRAPVVRSNSEPTPTLTPTTGRLPLEGLRVIDFTVVWAGPYSTMHLAEWGAEVIRVESTQFAPSTSRGFLVRPPLEMVQAMAATNITYPNNEPGERPWNRWGGFTHHARNKRSVTLDYASPEGQEILDRLIAVSDGLIENNLPPNVERNNITWSACRA